MIRLWNKIQENVSINDSPIDHGAKLGGVTEKYTPKLSRRWNSLFDQSTSTIALQQQVSALI